MKRSKTESGQEAQWQTTPLANLVRNTASGNYYARVRLKGKLIWKSLKTDRLAVAKLRLGDFLKGENHRAEIVQSATRGKMTFGDAVVLYKQRLDNAQHLKPRAKEYRQSTIDALLKTWTGLEVTDVRNITATDCSQWAAGFGKKYCPSFFNNTVGTLRQILKIALDAGARYGKTKHERADDNLLILWADEAQRFVTAAVRRGSNGKSSPSFANDDLTGAKAVKNLVDEGRGPGSQNSGS